MLLGSDAFQLLNNFFKELFVGGGGAMFLSSLKYGKIFKIRGGNNVYYVYNSFF